MGISCKISRSQLSAYMEERLERINSALIMELQNIGEKCVNHAREISPDDGFNDQTGNLRSSIGYVIYANGRPVSTDFKEKGGPKGDGKTGKSTGEKLAKEIADKYRNGIVLVVVAGMNYALYVESKNRDVLTSAEQLADDLVPKMLKQLKDNINRMQ